jgi:hypothetical protein
VAPGLFGSGGTLRATAATPVGPDALSPFIARVMRQFAHVRGARRRGNAGGKFGPEEEKTEGPEWNLAGRFATVA